MPGAFTRDPISVTWDVAAARLLALAYAARGEWAAIRVADPTPTQLGRWRSLGIDPLGPDNPSSVSGKRNGLNARDRWRRGFVRSIHYQNKGGRPLEVEVGRHVPASGVRPAHRPVRARLRRGGSVAMRAVQRKPDLQRIFDDAGNPAGRWSDPAKRDW